MGEMEMGENLTRPHLRICCNPARFCELYCTVSETYDKTWCLAVGRLYKQQFSAATLSAKSLN